MMARRVSPNWFGVMNFSPGAVSPSVTAPLLV
jgi:hypothetical protein